MIEQLMESYVPNKILHRNSQVNKLNDIFNKFNEFETSYNLFILGATGSGKTTTIKKIIEKFPNKYEYVSANYMKSSLQVLKHLAKDKSHTFEDALNQVLGDFKNNKRVLIIDELSKMKNVQVFFDDINTLYRETGIPIIIITNKVTILDSIPNDAKLTLFFEVLSFNSYNANEIKAILKQRLNEIPKNKAITEIPENLLNFISAHAGKDGSCRVALDLLRRCIMAHNFEVSYAEGLIAQDDKNWAVDFYARINDTEKAFLEILVDLYSRNGDIKSGDISKIFLKKFPNYTSKARVSQLITTFEEEYGVLKTKYVRRGRSGGNFRLVSFCDSDVFNQFEEIVK